MILDFEKSAVKVYAMLMDNEATRDNDRLLPQQIWMKESKANSLEDFFQELVNGDLSHPESLRRMRQKIQEKHPKLRGEKYEARHGMKANVCQQLSFFDNW